MSSFEWHYSEYGRKANYSQMNYLIYFKFRVNNNIERSNRSYLVLVIFHETSEFVKIAHNIKLINLIKEYQKESRKITWFYTYLGFKQVDVT